MSHAGYLTKVFNKKERTKSVKDIHDLIKKRNIQFDGFVVTGISGIMMGSLLSHRMGKDLVIVRKDNDNSHSSYKVENYKFGKRYIFLDDLISSGKTIHNVKTSLDLCSTHNWLYGYGKKSKSKIISAILYNKIEYWGIKKINSTLKSIN